MRTARLRAARAKRAPVRALLLGLVLLSSGCAYGNQYTYANTRKLMDSDAPAVTKIVFAPLIGLFESVYAPVTSYMDSRDYVDGQRDTVYLSYIGAQTLYCSNLHWAYKFFGSFFVLPIDTAWFPVAGTMDTFQALTTPSPEPPPDRKPADRDPPERFVPK